MNATVRSGENPASCLPGFVDARACVSFVRGSVLTFLINNPALMPGFGEGEGTQGD